MRFELIYSTGGHGGPYASEGEAKRWAEALLKGGKDSWIALVPYERDMPFTGPKARAAWILHRGKGWEKGPRPLPNVRAYAFEGDVSGSLSHKDLEFHVSDEEDAEELTLFADNTGELYEKSWKPIAKKLVTEKLAGRYSREDAIELFLEHADCAAARYQREIERHRFSEQAKLNAAKDWADHFETQFKTGELLWLYPKDYRANLNGLDVANEIWRQLGRARVMIGAKDPMGDKDSLTFKVGANPKRVKWIKIRLDPSDTYTVRFVDSKGRPLYEVDGIYADNLLHVIEMHTGLRTSL